jgi:hypothetical protein
MHTDAANLHATAAVPEYHEHALPPGFILAFATHRPLLQSFVVGLVIVGMALNDCDRRAFDPGVSKILSVVSEN